MRYIINSSIAFRVEDGALYRIESNDTVVLPIPAQRLLLIILESGGSILRREFLLQEVWDKFGLVGSNNNLNQYLSLLRRTVSAFGCEEFIETIPKVGIKIIDGVQIERDNTENALSQDSGENDNVIETRLFTHYTKGLFRIWSLKNIMAFSLLLIVLIFLSVIVHVKTGVDQTPVTSTLKGGCHLVLYSELNSQQYERISAKVNDYLKKNDKSCHPGVTIYFDDISSQSLYGKGRTLLSYCESDKKGINDVCLNYFFGDGLHYDK